MAEERKPNDAYILQGRFYAYYYFFTGRREVLLRPSAL